jgi:hypothetical protein
LTELPIAPAPIAPVVVLHPDGIRVRTEERDGVTLYWVERWRATRSTTAVMYDRDELQQLRDAIDRVLA